MSVINNMLKDLEIRSSQFTPIEIATVGQGARAMQAAHTGIEWVIYESVVNGNCAPNAFTATGTALNAYNINVTCNSSSHTEGALLITTYRLTSTAQTGTYGTLDYVFRSMQATVSIQPP